MSILVDKKTRLVVQGITGGEGTFHTQQMIAKNNPPHTSPSIIVDSTVRMFFAP